MKANRVSVELFNEIINRFEIKMGTYIENDSGILWTELGTVIWKSNGGVGNSRHLAGDEVGWVCKGGYRHVKTSLGGIKYTIKVHRISWMIYNNKPFPPDMDCDHIDHNILNNDPRNLRAVSVRTNTLNKKNCRSDSTTKLIGINFNTSSGMWRVRLENTKFKRHIGTFKSPVDAVNAYWSRRIEIEPEMENSFKKLIVSQMQLASQVTNETLHE
jgi:hypothetical protein